MDEHVLIALYLFILSKFVFFFELENLLSFLLLLFDIWIDIVDVAIANWIRNWLNWINWMISVLREPLYKLKNAPLVCSSYYTRKTFQVVILLQLLYIGNISILHAVCVRVFLHDVWKFCGFFTCLMPLHLDSSCFCSLSFTLSLSFV